MIYTDVINNVKFRAYYDKERRVLHVLDESGSEPYQSVTNGIDNLLPVLEKVLSIKSQYRILLYGTDSLVSNYQAASRSFEHVPDESPSINREFYEKMSGLYGG